MLHDVLSHVLPAETVRSQLVFDPNEYMHFLEECDWTAEQKEAFIAELWKIVISFVELGHGIHPIQRVNSCSIPLEPRSPSMLGFGETSENQQAEAARTTMLAGAEDS